MKVTQLSMFGVPAATVGRARRKPRPRQLVGRVLNCGAGLQSSTLVEMIVEGELPPVDVVIFSDTRDEPAWVYEQVRYLRDRLSAVDIPLVEVLKPGYGIVGDAVLGHDRFASMPLYTRAADGSMGILRRQCTNEYKIQPIKDWLLDWLLDRGYGKQGEDKNGQTYRRVVSGVQIEQWYGITLDEIERMSDRGPNWQQAVYPLIDKRMKRSDCQTWLRDRGLPVPRKSSCRVCPFHDDQFWANLKADHPGDFEHACRFDDWLRTPEAAKRFTRKLRQPVFLHRSGEALKEIDFDSRLALPLFETRDMCGAYCYT